jgi:DNA-binding winged helix-turn-helix (wHTH) protein
MAGEEEAEEPSAPIQWGLMERHSGRLIFGNFCLEIASNPYIPNEVHRTLYFRNAKAEHHPEPLQLKLLECLARRPGQPLPEAYLSLALRREVTDIGKNVQQHVSRLRQSLEHSEPLAKHYIETVPHGYKFVKEVRREGDLGGIEAFLRWPEDRFFQLLESIEADEKENRPDNDEDLRIVTVAFAWSISAMHLDDLISRSVRTRIVMMNPENEELLKARHGLRDEPRKTWQQGQAEIREQLEELADIIARAPSKLLEVRVCDAMPAGFIAHSKNWAIAGMFLAHCAYLKGPMIEVSPDTELWKRLYRDWQVRWEHPAPVPKELAQNASHSRLL